MWIQFVEGKYIYMSFEAVRFLKFLAFLFFLVNQLYEINIDLFDEVIFDVILGDYIFICEEEGEAKIGSWIQKTCQDLFDNKINR